MISAPVRPATQHDRGRVVDTIVAAFAADPAFSYFFPGEEYADQAPIFAGHLFDQRAVHGGVWVAEDGAAVALWNPPGIAPTWPPPGQSERVVQRLERYDGEVHRLLPTAPHWYLGVLATHPEHAGRRLGRAVMAAGLERARQDGLPAYLETVTRTNVAIYTASGWQVTGSTVVDGLEVWVLRHA